jgi:voltage-gated potassium channel Kch
VLVLAIDEPEKATMIAEEVQRHFPHLKVLARAESMEHAYELMHLGVNDVFRETFDSALSLGIETMKALGIRAYEAHRVAKQFKRHEREN